MSGEGALPELSVVVACSRPGAVGECLQGLATQPEAGRIEVFVAGALPAQRRSYPFPVAWIDCPQRHPNVRRNLALARARGKRVALLDDDTTPEPGWLAAALEVPGGCMVARTGPELPAGRTRAALVAHAVSSSPIGRLGTGHHHDARRPLVWYKVPFCNFVASRAVFEIFGPLSESIPWDMDDFDFCLRARESVRFEADPALRVRHDRYPESLSKYLRRVASLRLRTGEKLVTHPQVYGRIPLLVGCAALPIAGVVLAVLQPRVLVLALLGYVTIVLAQVPHAWRRLGAGAVPSFLVALTATHALTIGAAHAGIWKALGEKFGDWLRRRARLAVG